MTRGARVLGFLLLLLALSNPASAQYLFLDTNGDGAHTDADVIQPSGATTLDVWIRTDQNRDGSPAACDTDDGAMTINGYEVILHAVNGTVSWGSVTNLVPSFSASGSPAFDSQDLHTQAFGSTLPPGAYRLASIQVTPASGTPAIAVAAHTPLSGVYATGFVSQCSGLEFSNVLTLGVDWFDVDGAAYGGVANTPPVLDPIPDLTIAEGQVLDQTLTARDADGNPLTFRKASGPGYATVFTLDPGTGTATGQLHLSPLYTDAGVAVASIEASDGNASAAGTVRITVQNTDRAPSMNALHDMYAGVGGVFLQDLYAIDPDGGTLHFLLVDGPGFVTVTTTDAISPASGKVRVAPGLWDAGTWTVRVGASDGELQGEQAFTLVVFQGDTQTLLCRPYDMTVTAGTSAEQVVMASGPQGAVLSFSLLDSPAFASIAADGAPTTPQTARLRIAPGAGDLGIYSVTVRVDGGLVPVYETCRIAIVAAASGPVPEPDQFTSSSRSYDVCDIPQGAVIADLNRDGYPDLITPNYGCGISILLGIGQGQFAEHFDVHLDGDPKGVEVGDLNGDGILDAAVALGQGNQIALLAGNGSGGFTQVGALPAGPDAAYVAIVDLNRDGRPDLVGADEAGNTISVYLGTGAMQFGPRSVYPAGVSPCFVTVTDLNGDGVPDVVAANEDSNALTLHLGRGDGTLAQRTLLPTGPGPSSVRAGDFNEDGHIDLAASDFHVAALTVLFGDGQGAFPGRVDLSTGRAPWSLTVADINGDGHLDLASANTGTDDVGIRLGNGDGSFGPLLLHPVGYIPRFVAAGDLNGDHRTDLAVAHEEGSTLALLMGNGDGTFGTHTSIGREPTLDVAVGDVTGDRVTDLVAVLADRGVVQVRPGLGGGRYGAPLELTPDATPTGVALADMNKDGVLDLLLPLSSSSWALYFGGSALGQSPPVLVSAGGHASGIAAGDWNRDGIPDVALVSVPDSRLTLLDGDGAGGFSNPRTVTAPSANRVATGDWDGDGWTDFAVDTGRGTQIVWGGVSGLTVGPLLLSAAGTVGAASADLDGDGRDDLVVAERGSNGGINLYVKLPHARLAIYRFTSRAAAPSRTVLPGGPGGGNPKIADVTGDGRPDLIITEAGSSAIGVIPGLPGGAFDARRDYGAGSGGPGIAIADVDGDGRPDLLSTNIMPLGLTLLRNLGAAAPLAARAFLDSGDRILRLFDQKPWMRVHLEPVGGSFAAGDVDLGSVRLRLAGGPGPSVPAMTMKGATVEDFDGNGVPDIAVQFAKPDLRSLLASVRGSADVAATLDGSLTGGAKFLAPLTLRVLSAPGRPPAVTVAPNPLNPVGMLRFTLDRPGRLRVIVYDAAGRTRLRLVDSKSAKAGEFRIPVGSGRGSSELASGIYFYRVETMDGATTGKFAVLK